ncbi:amidohydrolase family protein [Ketobacter sp. MCCC 1A13808]|uniref:metal-dependent hydrolase family protein n=1 Tax=Ketobacter sp. MCCC 1A13808 TaxID=2602738 RepID=UPI0012EC64A4|nr:amidohydrolase family protein [Ketobacter sp. MCCC 1A13808]MVF13472.1 amidohydrolase family protein [Ketobacter sp. MCCC 1A13808]
MSRLLIRGARIFDATGTDPYAGDVLVEGNRIKRVLQSPAQIPAEGCEVINANGLFLMPGMTEGHGHLSFDNVTSTGDLITPSPEEHTLLTARVAERLLDQGFTSVWGASEAKLKLGVAVRNAINAGQLKGPRVRAGSLEISVTGGMGDESRQHDPRPGGPSHIVDGPEEMRKAVRLACREGCDNIKLDVSGDPFYPNTPAYTTPMTFEEIKMAVDTAHAFGRRVNAHVRSIEGAKRCLQAGVDALFHCEFTDEETLDLFEEAKDRVFVVPTVSLFHTLLYEAEPYMSNDIAKAMQIDKLLEASQDTHNALRKRGIRHTIGGDYGFAWSHNGTNARDIGFFVQYFGYSPTEALVCATANGGAMMTMGTDEKLGLIQEGYLADLLLVKGDPIADPAVVVDAENLKLIMKDGAIHKNIVAAE